MPSQIWKQCVENLSFHFQETLINTWVRPLHAVEKDGSLQLLAPNSYVQKWVNEHCLTYIKQVVPKDMTVALSVGSLPNQDTEKSLYNQSVNKETRQSFNSFLNSKYTFDSFVEGKNNQLAYAVAKQVSQSPGQTGCNPLFIYGGVGLGKTHLIHALGNKLLKNNPHKKVRYLHSEDFVTEMVSAISHKTMGAFKEKYRSIDTLLVDDIQLFVGKKQSQEEFFHTFNALFEKGQQIVLTSDRYPKSIEGLPERLVSRFVQGLAQAIEPPEYETRVAILSKKAEQEDVSIPQDVLLFIAKQVHSNVRELEGAMRSVITYANFFDTPISLAVAKIALEKLIAANSRLVSLENIQKKTCEYFQIRSSDLVSPNRSRSIVRPRQIAMSLARELTNHSLPEIGEAFGGRDHTTVMNACARIDELRRHDQKIDDDYKMLVRILSV